MPKTRSGHSTENTNKNHQSQGSSVPSPPLSSHKAALPPPPPQSAPQYTSLETSCTTSQQAPQVDPSTSLSSPLTSDMDSDPDSCVKSLIGTLVHHLQQITQTPQEPRQIIWYNELREANAPTFIGAPDPAAAEKWIKDMEKLYRAMEVPHDKWVKLAVPFLSGNAEMWYETIEAVYGQIDDWETFKDHFYKNYFPMPVRNQKIKEFVNLKQGSMTVLEYAHKFFELGKFVPDVMEDELMKIGKFEEGFNFVIKSGLLGQRANDFSDLLEKAIRAENMNNILSQTIAGVKKTIEADQTCTTVTTPVNDKKLAVTTLTTPQCQKCNKQHSGECKVWSGMCFQCGQMGHVRNSCPNRGQTQTSAQTQTNAQTTSQDGVCFQCGQMGHVRNSCPNRGQTQTSAQTTSQDGVCFQCGQIGHVRNSCPNRGQTQTSAQTTSQDGMCFQCGQMGHVRNSCPNRGQTTSEDAPRRGKRKCTGRVPAWTAQPKEVDETNATDISAELGSDPGAVIHLPGAVINLELPLEDSLRCET